MDFAWRGVRIGYCWFGTADPENDASDVQRRQAALTNCETYH
jgi:hypothetical protein